MQENEWQLAFCEFGVPHTFLHNSLQNRQMTSVQANLPFLYLLNICFTELWVEWMVSKCLACGGWRHFRLIFLLL